MRFQTITVAAALLMAGVWAAPSPGRFDNFPQNFTVDKIRSDGNSHQPTVSAMQKHNRALPVGDEAWVEERRRAAPKAADDEAWVEERRRAAPEAVDDEAWVEERRRAAPEAVDDEGWVEER